MLQLVFDRNAIHDNIEVIKRRAGSAVIYAVLTCDGYGAGLTDLAALLRGDGITHFAVQEVADARALRNAGFETEELLMLRSTADPDELRELMELGVVCTVGSYESAVALNALAEEQATVAEAHVLIDTGMGLGGFLPSEPEKLLSIYQYLPNVAISGTYTQLCAAGNDVQGQMELFQSTLDTLHSAGLNTGIAHAAGSSALMRSEGVQLDAVRVGSAVLGRCRCRRGDGLKNACHAEATLDTVRWLPKGSTIGNFTRFRLGKPTRVAVISAGYQNGFGVEPPVGKGLWAALQRRRRMRRRCVTWNGAKARLLGHIGATETAIDVTDLKCSAGDTVCFDIDPIYAKGFQKVFR